MQIWVDADACPRVIKDFSAAPSCSAEKPGAYVPVCPLAASRLALFRAAERQRIALILIANKPLLTPPSQYIRALQVPAGFDVADNHIIEQVQAGDLVITADIPLAAAVIARAAHALNPRGELYTPENIRERLNMRDFMDQLRSTGVNTGGPAVLSLSDRQAFANQLDRFLNRHARAQG